MSSGSQAASEVAAEAPTASQAASAISKSADAGVQVKPAPEVASEVPKPAKPAKKPRTVASAAQPTVSAAAAEKASVDAKPKKPKKKEGVTPKHSERAKLVRDSFTMPEADFSLLAQMKRRSLSLQRETKKSELLRAGLQVLASMSDVDLVKALNALAPIKTGRPKKR